jgi:DNA repair exonuclease SbcCD ATPase subunit/DNA repair exonuclease SbcCD nuclease subunit
MVKIIHLSDTHIKNLNYHADYRIIFDQIFEKLRSEKPDIIVHCGDLGHTKTNISPEFVDLCSYFLKNLGDIAPTWIILGNHDGNLRNDTRQDAISPIITALNHPNLRLLKKSGEYPFGDEIVFNVMSIFDLEGWKEPTSLDKINIALYHGSINGCDTDLGWTMTHADNDLSIFDKMDYALLGDIHKTNQILDDDGKCRYVGSTIQQNHGETNDKGFLIWEIESKEKFNTRHISFPNPRPFISIDLNPNGSLPNVEIAPNARLRLIAKNNLSLDVVRKTIDIARTKFKPENITFLDRAENKGSVLEMVGEFKKEDLRNLEVQERLIEEFLKDYKIDNNLLKRVFEINKNYNNKINDKDLFAHNVDFKILKFEWNNLFNYGQNNVLDFSNLNGIVGIFGKNYSGKSNVIDGLLYSIFNSITKKNKKLLNLINLNSNDASSRVWLKIDDKNYRISRKASKYVKKLHGNETIEAKGSVDFELIDPITGDVLDVFNGIDGDETNKNIMKLFGTKDDFLLTSMSSQLGSLTYIDKGSTERKEILARFLDLDFFAEKFELANKDVAELKSSLRRFEGINFKEQLEEATSLLKANEDNTNKTLEECNELKLKLSSLEVEKISLENLIKNSPTNIIDIKDVLEQISKKEKLIKDYKEEISNAKNKIEENENKLKKVGDFIVKFNVNKLKEKEKISREIQQDLDKLIREIENSTKELDNDNKKIELLKQVPCGPEFSNCKFIKGAYAAQENISIVNLTINKLQTERKNLEAKQEINDVAAVREQLSKYEILLEKQNSFYRDLENNKLLIENKKANLLILEHEMEKLVKLKENYNKDKELIDNLEGTIKEKDFVSSAIKGLKDKLSICDKKVQDFYKNHGSLEQKITRIKEEIEEFRNLNENYEAYDLFLKTQHVNGISYDVIKKSLPTINGEIAKNLTNIVDFEVFFKNEENRLELYIKRPNDIEALPVEMGSVAQKMLAAMAIRLAFIHVSSLPKSDVFILDEPGTALDAESMEGFIRMLEVIKSHFKSVLMISHLDSLKDVADLVINVDNKSGIAQLTS